MPNPTPADIARQLDLQQFRDLINRVRDGRKVGYEQVLLTSLALCVAEIEGLRARISSLADLAERYTGAELTLREADEVQRRIAELRKAGAK